MESKKPRKMVRFAAYAISVVFFLTMVVGVEFAATRILRLKGENPSPFLFQRSLPVQDNANQVWFDLLDPQLSHAHDPEVLARRLEDYESIPGFVVYGDRTDSSAIRIFALGGSTTGPWQKQCWPQALQDSLRDAGIRTVVFNGGVAGYSSNQELLKLVRDVLPLNPDIVLSLSGINDIGFAASVEQHPMVHPHLDKTLRTMGKPPASALLPNAYRVLSSLLRRTAEGPRVSYGPIVSTTPAEQWERNMRLMHGISREFGFPFLSFRQPTMGVGEYTPTDKEREALQELVEPKEGSQPELNYLVHVERFYQRTEDIEKRLPYVLDLVDLFREVDDVYRDPRHQNAKGAKIIAEAILKAMLDPRHPTAVVLDNQKPIVDPSNLSFEV